MPTDAVSVRPVTSYYQQAYFFSVSVSEILTTIIIVSWYDYGTSLLEYGPSRVYV